MGIFDLPFLFDDRDLAFRSLDSVGMDIGKAKKPREPMERWLRE